MTSVALLSWLRFGVVPYPSAAYASWDQVKYVAMALHPLSGNAMVHVAPFSWRILTPLIVHALPLPFKAGFYLVNFASLALAGPFLYAWLRRTGQPHRAALMASIGFYSLYWSAWFLSFDYLLVDGLGLLVMAVGVGLVVRDDVPWWTLSAVLAVGVLAKESALFLVLSYFLVALTRVRWSAALLLTARVAALPVAVDVLLRLAIHHTNPYNYLSLLLAAPGLKPLRVPVGPRLLVGALHVLWTFTFATWGLLLLPAASVLVLLTVRLLSWEEVRSQASGSGRGVLSAVGAAAVAYLAGVLVGNPTRAVLYAFPLLALLWCISLPILGDRIGGSVAAGWVLIGGQVAAILAGFDSANGGLISVMMMGVVVVALGVVVWRATRPGHARPVAPSSS